MSFDWQFFLNASVYDALFAGLRTTIEISLYAAIGSTAVGVVVGLAQTSGWRWAARTAEGYVAFFRNIPLLVQLFFWYFGLPAALPPAQFPFLYEGRFEVSVAVLTLSLAWGAFVGEIVRAGVESVSIGQADAALSAGLTKVQAFRYVIIPQTWPVILPGLTSEMMNVVKSTSLVMTIGVSELTWQAQQIESETFRGFEAMTLITVTYLALSLLIVGLGHIAERLTRRP